MLLYDNYDFERDDRIVDFEIAIPFLGRLGIMTILTSFWIQMSLVT